MSVAMEVRADLVSVNGDKAKLMQKYSDDQKEILQQYGGNLGDIPMNDENPYHELQRKITHLGTLSC